MLTQALLRFWCLNKNETHDGINYQLMLRFA